MNGIIPATGNLLSQELPYQFLRRSAKHHYLAVVVFVFNGGSLACFGWVCLKARYPGTVRLYDPVQMATGGVCGFSTAMLLARRCYEPFRTQPRQLEPQRCFCFLRCDSEGSIVMYM